MVKSTSLLVALAFTLAIFVLSPVKTEAVVSCDTVRSDLYPCLQYVLYGFGPSEECCRGVTTLYGQANTTPNRQAICKCIKSVAANVNQAILANAASLPGKCGVTIGYKISSSINCDTIKYV